MVHLRDSLSNLREPVKRLLTALDRDRGPGNTQVKAHAEHAAVAQVGADEQAVVRVEIKENHKLSPTEIDELVGGYVAGEAMLKLARRFGVHKHTVRQYLIKRGVPIRPKAVFTDAQEREVIRLYVEQQQTLAEIAPVFAVSPGAVRNVLRRRGVERRGQVRRMQ